LVVGGGGWVQKRVFVCVRGLAIIKRRPGTKNEIERISSTRRRQTKKDLHRNGGTRDDQRKFERNTKRRRPRTQESSRIRKNGEMKKKFGL